MTTQNPNKEIAEQAAAAMHDLRQSIETSHEISIRIGRRTTQIIRLGMITVLVLGVVLAYLITTLASDFKQMTLEMSSMSGNMERMETHFAEVNTRMTSMAGNLDLMTQSVQVLPGMATTMNSLEGSTQQMAVDVERMVGNMDNMSGNVGSMAGDLNTINQNVSGMAWSVQDMSGSMRHMNREMRDLSRPVDFMPFK